MTERAPRILVLVGPATGGIGAHAAALSAGVADRGGTVAVVCPGLTAERFTWRVPVVLAWPGGGLLEVWRRWRRLRELVATADVVSERGEVCGFAPPGDIHRVRNEGPGRAISLHVYGADLSRFGTSVRRVYPQPADR